MPFDEPKEPHPCTHNELGFCEFDEDCEHKELKEDKLSICNLEV